MYWLIDWYHYVTVHLKFQVPSLDQATPPGLPIAWRRQRLVTSHLSPPLVRKKYAEFLTETFEDWSTMHIHFLPPQRYPLHRFFFFIYDPKYCKKSRRNFKKEKVFDKWFYNFIVIRSRDKKYTMDKTELWCVLSQMVMN